MKTFLGLLIFFFIAFSSKLNGQNISTGKYVIETLASDSLEGRLAGTHEDFKAAKFLSNNLDKFNLDRFWPTYLQDFEITTDILLNSDSFVRINNKELIAEQDYTPFTFTGNIETTTEIIYVKDLQDTSLFVDGKCILYRLENSENKDIQYRTLIKIGIMALERGAGALILVADTDLGFNTEFYPFKYNRSSSKLSLPVIQISRNTLTKLSQQEGYSGNKYDTALFEFLSSEQIMLNLELKIKTSEKIGKTYNIAGFITSETSDDWIVIGAHYDHLGFGGYGSGSRKPELHKIHSGADDNASGVAVVMMLAEYYSKHSPEVNIAFVLFGAEEQGLLGSKHFVENMPDTISKIKCMLNYDMVGRLGDTGLSIMGATSASQFDSVLNLLQTESLKINAGGGGLSGSDQASFYSEKIPVLFFNTGMHTDYHTPFDDITKINFNGLLNITNLSILLIDKISNPHLSLDFVQSKQSQKARHGGEMKVKLGIMPDMTSRNSDGLRVDGISPGGIADNSGILKGDKIIQIGDKNIGGIYEYMHAMSELETGQKTIIKINRNEEIIEIRIDF
ncbi:MAG: M28 family peptidase [Bacteroidales bacterium]|nr:M28 family peptidase [Bacteroidales bacterium]